MTRAVNLYGDIDIRAGDGCHGIDVALQRSDDLDEAAVDAVLAMAAAGVKPLALDLGCAAGGQMARMAEAGALVAGYDLADTGDLVRQHAGHDARFLRGDLHDLHRRQPADWGCNRVFDIVLSQRTIHYLSWQAAADMLAAIRDQLLRPGGLLFLSASGLVSELSDGYPTAQFPVTLRHHELAPKMREKHGIHGAVTLYTLDELVELCADAGYTVCDAWLSPFGNVKLVASNGVWRV